MHRPRFIRTQSCSSETYTYQLPVDSRRTNDSHYRSGREIPKPTLLTTYPSSPLLVSPRSSPKAPEPYPCTPHKPYTDPPFPAPKRQYFSVIGSLPGSDSQETTTVIYDTVLLRILSDLSTSFGQGQTEPGNVCRFTLVPVSIVSAGRSTTVPREQESAYHNPRCTAILERLSHVGVLQLGR